MKWGLTSLTSVAWNAGARVVVNGVVTGSPKQTWRRYALVDVGLAMDTYTNTHTYTNKSFIDDVTCDDAVVICDAFVT